MHPANTMKAFAVHLREQMLWLTEFNSMAIELFALQLEANEAYRGLCRSRGFARGAIGHWSEIPAVPAAAFKELTLSCIPAEERTSVFFSSGTTAQRPSRHFHHQKSLEIYEASLLGWFGVHLVQAAPLAVGPGPQVIEGPSVLRGLALTPTREDAPNSSLVHMFDTLRRSLKFTGFAFTGLTVNDGGWELNRRATFGFLQEAIEANEPVVLLGPAFSYVHFLEYLAEQKLKLRLPEGSRVLETGGYKGRSRALPKSKLHALITSVLGVPPSRIVCEYGMSELSSQAYDQIAATDERMVNDEAVAGRIAASSRCFRFPAWVRIQIISPETGREVGEGETGLIRVFDLANVYSVMAIQTEDLAIRRGEGFELIGRAALAEARGCSLMAG